MASGSGRRSRVRPAEAVADKLREVQRQQDAGVDVRKKSITVAEFARGSNGRSFPPVGSAGASSTS